MLMAQFRPYDLALYVSFVLHSPRMTANAIDDFIPPDIHQLYEVHNYRNAAQILSTGCAAEFQELLEGLRTFRLTIADTHGIAEFLKLAVDGVLPEARLKGQGI